MSTSYTIHNPGTGPIIVEGLPTGIKTIQITVVEEEPSEIYDVIKAAQKVRRWMLNQDYPPGAQVAGLRLAE